MENIKQILTRDRYAKHSGIELVSVSPGQAVAQMLIQAHHLNALGSVQGGAIFTLADFAFAAASNAHGKAAVAINVSITYMKAASSGTLRAEARELSVNPKLGSYTVNVTDEHNTLIAVFQGLVYRKEQTLEELQR
jgi:acyl-CoA thioesterase